MKMTDPLDELTERLCVEFEPLLDPDTVADVVEQCCDEIQTAFEPLPIARVEQLARHQLGDLTVYTVTGALDYGAAAGSSIRVVVRW